MSDGATEVPVIDARSLVLDFKVNSDFESRPAVYANRAANCARGLAPLSLRPETRDGKIAIVGYGPSLQDSWPDLLRFDGPIWTVSKAHDFLLERGIQPTYHTDTDFREHKAGFNKLIGARTEYRIGTCVHPAYLDRLPAERTKLFHITPPHYGPYEAGYPKLECEYDVGTVAMRLAYTLGWREQHWYGFDFSSTPEGTHAGPHEGSKSDLYFVDVPFKDKTLRFGSTSLQLHAAMGVERMLRALPRLRPTIHGNGMIAPLLQARGKIGARRR